MISYGDNNMIGLRPYQLVPPKSLLSTSGRALHTTTQDKILKYAIVHATYAMVLTKHIKIKSGCTKPLIAYGSTN